MTIKQKKQQKEVAEKLKKHWNDTDIPWNPNYKSSVQKEQEGIDTWDYKLNHLYKTDNEKESK